MEAMEAMKASLHHGRTGSANHNDRSFDLSLAEHIDQGLTGENLNYCIYDDISFSDAELKFYKENFSESLNLQNERYKAERHPERVRNMEQVLHTKNKSPDETILQIGDMHCDIDADVFANAVQDYIEWHNDRYGSNMAIIDASVHVDEASPHAHIRTAAWYVDGNGIKHLGQEKALEQLGYNLPDESKKTGRYNNRKIAYTVECRDKWYDIAESYGFPIDRTPNPKKPKHKDKNEYIREQKEELAKREKIVAARERAADKIVAEAEVKQKGAFDALRVALKARNAAVDLLGEVQDQVAQERLKMASNGVTDDIKKAERALPNAYQKGRVQQDNQFSLD